MFRLIIFVYFLLISVSYSEEAMKIVYYDSFPPYSWRDTDGKMKGIWIDIIDEVFQKEIGIEVEHEGYPWSRAQYLVKNGEADALIGMANKERKTYMNFNSVPIYVSKIRIYTSFKNEKLDAIKRISSDEDLDKFSITDITGNGWSSSRFPNLKISYVRNLSSVFNVILSCRSDLAFSDSLVAEYYIKQNNLKYDIEEVSYILDRVESYLGIGKNSYYVNLLIDFDEAFKKLEENGIISKIISKYCD